MHTSKYVRFHIVEAVAMTRHEFDNLKNQEHSKPDEDGYKVTYPDGYVSWCPKAQFEEAGRELESDGIPFGMAIEAMKKGKRVARKGWNGKGMYLWLKPSAQIKAEWCKDERLKKAADENGGEILGLGTICMFTHDSTGRKAVLTGWLASQSDMLCDDWYVLAEEGEPAVAL